MHVESHTQANLDHASAIGNAFQQTQINHEAAIQLTFRNADNFGGVGSAAFQEEIAKVNQLYQGHYEAIGRFGQAFGQATDGFTECDAQCAAQYGGGGGGSSSAV